MKPFRVIDTGIREGRRQIAFDQALIDLHKAGRAPDTIRFLRFPPTALIGRHQALSREVKLDYCRANKVGVVRRVTGGGAIYLDEGQLGWELVFHRATLGIASLGDLARAICEAAACGTPSSMNIRARTQTALIANSSAPMSTIRPRNPCRFSSAACQRAIA